MTPLKQTNLLVKINILFSFIISITEKQNASHPVYNLLVDLLNKSKK